MFHLLDPKNYVNYNFSTIPIPNPNFSTNHVKESNCTGRQGRQNLNNLQAVNV